MKKYVGKVNKDSPYIGAVGLGKSRALKEARNFFESPRNMKKYEGNMKEYEGTMKKI